MDPILETTKSIVHLVKPSLPLKILVVEDNAINRKVLVKMLSSKKGQTVPAVPIEVVEAEDGIDALERFRKFDSPAIILLDINM